MSPVLNAKFEMLCKKDANCRNPLDWFGNQKYMKWEKVNISYIIVSQRFKVQQFQQQGCNSLQHFDGG